MLVQVDGSSFAHFDSSLMMRAGFTAAENSRWTSDSTLSLRFARGSDEQVCTYADVC